MQEADYLRQTHPGKLFRLIWLCGDRQQAFGGLWQVITEGSLPVIGDKPMTSPFPAITMAMAKPTSQFSDLRLTIQPFALGTSYEVPTAFGLRRNGDSEQTKQLKQISTAMEKQTLQFIVLQTGLGTFQKVLTAQC